MTTSKKSWREKVNAIQEKIHVITPEYEMRYGKGKLLVPSAIDIEAVINQTKPGELLTNNIIREVLAKQKGVLVTDPITVGIFLRIIAEASEEEQQQGKPNFTPYWRVFKPNGSINIKLPGGAKKQRELLEAEGHTTQEGKGKKPPLVVNFESSLKTNF